MNRARRAFLKTSGLAAAAAVVGLPKATEWMAFGATMPKAPSHILGIKYSNPTPPADFATTGAAQIARGEFPKETGLEWKQVLPPPDADYEGDLVGASGWVLDPQISGADLPFTHPFGRDWEFMFAVDGPPPVGGEPVDGGLVTDTLHGHHHAPIPEKPNYTSLLARGNQVREEDNDVINRARELDIPLPLGVDRVPSLLGVEIDSGIVPRAFSDAVAEGDRMAVFGRWIVDCGHKVKIDVPNRPPDLRPEETFRSEIHPPLVMASAKVANTSLATGSAGPPRTRVLFTSRPYLVSQQFTPNVGHIYDDSDPNADGNFDEHMVNEVRKVNDHIPVLEIPIGSSLVEAHPKIKSYPFQGVRLLHFVVRPPSMDPPDSGRSRGLVPELTASFQFTVRSGCAVSVFSTEPNTIEVLIALNRVGYTSPPLPERRTRRWSQQELAEMDSRANVAYRFGELLSVLSHLQFGELISSAYALAVLERGIETDEYDTEAVRSVNILDAQHSATVSAANLRAGNGVIQDDSQPYPVFGWLELGWGLRPPI